MFEQFDRSGEKPNRNIEGTGLGMNITEKLLQLMGSTMHVESEYGKGSKFSFVLKQKVVRWEELGDYESAYQQLLGKRKVYKEKLIAPDAEVLVIDDNPMNLMVFKSLLKQTRIKIDTANDGDEGLTLAYDKKYDVIFFDHMMPGKDGIETLQEMRSQEKNPNLHTPSICLTANAVSGAREQYIDAGFDDYLTKPIDTDHLETMLIRYLPDDKILDADDDDGMEESESDLALPDFLSQIDEINTEKGVINNGGDVEAYLQTLKVYVGMADKSVKEIRELYGAGDVKNAVIKIHALKSTSRIIGASEIGELAQQLEDAGKAGDTATLDAELEGLMNRTLAVGRALAPLLEVQKEAEDSDLPMIEEEKLQDSKDRIREFAEDCDDAGIESMLDKLSKYRLPEGEEEKLAGIREALDDFDFDRIGELLG